MHLKRAYELPEREDGIRILVDRLWPRGLTKEKAAIHLWLKEIAPSAELRKWFAHDPVKWKEFGKRYRQELKKNQAQVTLLKAQMKRGTVTLLYAAKDEKHNHALILKNWISRRL